MTKRTSRRVAVRWMAVLAASFFVMGCAPPASLSPTGVPSTSAHSTVCQRSCANHQYADSKRYPH